MEIFIYSLCDQFGDIRYIGQTIDLKRRYRDHISSSIKSDKTHKSRWIKKMILSGFYPEIIVLETTSSLVESNFLESFYITYLKSLGVKLTNSYITDVTEFSIETREKISKAKIGKRPSDKSINLFIERNKIYFTGLEKTEEQKNKISESLKQFFKNGGSHWASGREMDDEFRNKLRNSHLNNTKNVGNRNKKTEQEKNNLRLKNLGKTNKRLKISQIDKSGSVIKIWNSINEIIRELKISKSTLIKCIKENRTYCNYFWVKIDNK